MPTLTTERVYNFSAGPAVLPLPVLEEAQRDLICLPGAGASVLEISHRSKEFISILESAKQGIIELLGVPDTHDVLFLQGGARLQFSMIPMNLLRGTGRPAHYLVTGSWGKLAFDEARREGDATAIWDGQATNYDRLPDPFEYEIDNRATYLYFTSNETIQGVQFETEPASPVPLVCDASSDFLSRPVDVSRYGILYACAQKNAGPAGVTVVVIRKDLLRPADENLPGYLQYRSHADNDSMYNTPPTFAIYLLNLVARWLRDEIGGLDSMQDRNRAKARLLYEVIDNSHGFYQGHARTDCRSLMNVTFRLPDEQLEGLFVKGAAARQMTGLKGHRSVGGIRASIYNAMPLAGVEALRDYMRDFAAEHAKR